MKLKPGFRRIGPIERRLRRRFAAKPYTSRGWAARLASFT